MPHEWMELDVNEKAFICAAIDTKIEAEKKAEQRAKAESRRHR